MAGNSRLEIHGTLDERHAIYARSNPGYQGCPNCGDHMPVVYARPQYGAPSGHYERTGECRNCGPVTMKSGRLSEKAS